MCCAVMLAGKPDLHARDITTDKTVPPLTDSFSLLGSYLAGRIARDDQQLELAAEYYRRALDRDPGNQSILAQAFQMELSAGRLDKATELARRVINGGPGDFALAYLLLGVDAFNRSDYRQADIYFRIVGDNPVVDLTSALSRAWTEFARGKTRSALGVLSQPNEADRSQYFQHLHTGLMADLMGDRQRALTSYGLAFKMHSDNRRLVQAYARHAAHWGNENLARTLLSPFTSGRTKTSMTDLEQEVLAGGQPDLLVQTPRQGLAEVYFGIGGVLAGNRINDVARIYLNIVRVLSPDHDQAHYLLGEVETASGRLESALASYERVRESSSLWLDAYLRSAFLLNALKRPEEAIIRLEELSAQYPDEPRLLQATGNILRDQKEYARAATYYTRAIELISEPAPEDWIYFFARGICYERIKEWPKAEADLKRALELNPDEPSVLNYLGYSWVDQNIHVEAAMELIRKAVQLDPDNGYYVDSLGWAYYRMGDFQNAVKQLDRAVELRPEDPVLNDHLGDAYWQVGRRLEARYQWSQALSLNPEPEDEVRIRAKLQNGLEPESTRAAKSTDASRQPAPAQ
jgi:tetratricopeptide (TPR) repeat protein